MVREGGLLRWLRESALGRWFGSSLAGQQLESKGESEEFDVSLLPPEALDPPYPYPYPYSNPYP